MFECFLFLDSMVREFEVKHDKACNKGWALEACFRKPEKLVNHDVPSQQF